MVGRRLFANRKGYCPSSSEQVPETLVVDDERRRIRLLVPVELGLKNVKAITRITYSAEEPKDYWAPYGYSSYDEI